MGKTASWFKVEVCLEVKEKKKVKVFGDNDWPYGKKESDARRELIDCKIKTDGYLGWSGRRTALVETMEEFVVKMGNYFPSLS